ncbi:MAG: methyltransferase type 12 [Friedmanniella sp.]|nr:methyltransferase type 12 [Friedmanniella sp.]
MTSSSGPGPDPASTAASKPAAPHHEHEHAAPQPQSEHPDRPDESAPSTGLPDAEPVVGHTHDHGGAEHVAEMMTEAFWDDRYGASESVWSGQPNLRLVEQVAALSPGRALDVGSGEGADAIWLATQGWTVTGLDFSAVGLARSAERAAAAGSEVAARITWEQADIRSWSSPPRYDLVSAHFLHFPPEELAAVHQTLAAAVAPGGTLLIVGHHPHDLETTVNRPRVPEMFYTAEEVGARLDGRRWRIEVAAEQQRPAVNPEGERVVISDAVLRAVRRSDPPATAAPVGS